MTSSQFDPGSTSKTLNLSLLRFNERSGFENLAHIRVAFKLELLLNMFQWRFEIFEASQPHIKLNFF